MPFPDPLLLATGNPGKVRELLALLGQDAPREVRSLSDFPGYVPPDESAPDYPGNARLKAHHAARTLGLPALADDSGIEVDALGSRPGVHSARYAGEGATDADNNRKLIQELCGQQVRTARYRCVVVLAFPDGREFLGEGTCEGCIGESARGEGGFGYDPWFELPDGRTMAELPAAEKDRISHRAGAMQALRQAL